MTNSTLKSNSASLLPVRLANGYQIQLHWGKFYFVINTKATSMVMSQNVRKTLGTLLAWRLFQC